MRGWVRKSTKNLERCRVCVGGRERRKPKAQGGGRSVGARRGRSREGHLVASELQKPPPSTQNRDKLLPERPKNPRPRAAQRPSSARRSPGEGPGIAAAGETQEARATRALSWARGPRGAARRVGCGGGRIAPRDWFNVGNLVSKEGAVAEAAGRRESERAPGPRPREGVLAGARAPRGLRGGLPNCQKPSAGGRALPRHPRRRRGGRGVAGLPFSTPHPTPSLHAVIISWTRSSAPIFSPSHQRPLGRGLIWSAQGSVDAVLAAGVGCHLH